MKTYIQFLATALLFFTFLCIQAQDGTNDPSFNPLDRDTGKGFSNDVHDLVIQEDGKSVAVGSFFGFDGKSSRGIARLTTRGYLDPTFNPGTGFEYPNGLPGRKVLLIQPDGKYLVGGDFNVFNGAPAIRIIRINPDGTKDETFSTGSGFELLVGSMVLLPDGKVLVGGKFTTYNGAPAKYLVRLNQDGSIDLDFNPQIPDIQEVDLVKVQPDGKILINSANSLFRIHPDGTIDSSFALMGKGLFNQELDMQIYSILLRDMVVLDDGKILISGNIAKRFPLLRLNEDGTVDKTFNRMPGRSGYDLIIDEMGRIYAFGYSGFIKEDDDNYYYFDQLKRLFPDGTVDPSFFLGQEYSDGQTMALQKDGKLLMLPHADLNRFNNDGSKDWTYNSEPEFNDWVTDLTIQKDGKIVVVGKFTAYNGNPVNRIARLLPDGTLDNSFETGKGFEFIKIAGEYSQLYGFPEGVILQEDGKLLVYGDFNFYNGSYAKNMVRINPDGSMDTSFDPGPDFRLSISALALQSDGKILMDDPFPRGLNPTKGMVRLFADGKNDPSFDTGTGFKETDSYWGGEFWTTPSNIIVLEDGKFLVSGDFNIYNGIPVNNLIRLNPDGSLDTGFVTGLVSIKQFTRPLVQADGKIIVAVRNGLTAKLIRLNANGSLDDTFNFHLGDGRILYQLSLQRDGKILVTNYLGNKLLRLNSNSSIDPTFRIGELEYGRINSIALQPDGNIVLGGYFSEFNGEIRNNIVRLLNKGDEPIPLTEVIRINSGGEAMVWEGENWQADVFYQGGRINKTTEDILFTEKDFVYQSERYGDFSYTIPVPEAGLYTVELYFSEIHWQKPNARIFNFSLEKEQLTLRLDLFRELGGWNRPMVITAQNIKVEDGKLSLDMVTEKDRAKLSGIAIFRQSSKVISQETRINAGGPALLHEGEIWLADQNFLGGRTYLNDSLGIENTENDALYQTERYGTFNYNIPVPKPGLYSLELHFAEIHWNRENARIFGVEVENGQFALRNIDLFKNYGGSRSASKILIDSIEVTDGNLDIQLISQKENPKISGIYVSLQKPNDPNLPDIVNLTDINIEIGKKLIYKVEIPNTQAGDLWFSSEDLPGGLTIDPFTGIITGQIAAVGKFPVTLKIKDRDGNRSIAIFTISVGSWKELRINAGGGAIMTGDKQWMADNFFNGGVSFNPAGPILLPDDQLSNEELYETERISAGSSGFNYQIPVLENGFFTVEVYFRTTPYPAGLDLVYPGLGLFELKIENLPVYGQLYNETKIDGALVRTWNTVEVKDGVLNLIMQPLRVNPKIAAIVVTRENMLSPFYRINSGGDTFLFSNQKWISDQFYTGGSVHRNRTIPIGNTQNELLYQSERFGNFSYSIPAPEVGLYTVELHVAEIYWNQSGARLFDLTIENGQFTAENIDLYQRFGPRSAGVLIAENIEVKDGLLDINVKKKINNPSLSGIVMYRQWKETEGAGTYNLRSIIEQNISEPEEVTPDVEKPMVTSLYPNPARDRFHLGLTADRAGPWGFTLVSSLGATLIHDQHFLEAGYHSLEFDLSNLRLSAGIYYFTIQTNNAAPVIKKLIIQ